MKRVLGIIALFIASTLFAIVACNTHKHEAATAKSNNSGINLSHFAASPDFPGATIGIQTVKAAKVGDDSAKVSFAFDVKNYQLKMQTSDKDNKLCNNSDKGQHIHFILDNQPYKALYEPKNDVVLANGTEHYLMAFLSRSYHESLKSPGAAVVYHFRVDEQGNLKKLDDPKTPMLFYSRPKGDYVGKDTANVLLDYYVWNCSLSRNDFKVKAVILKPMSDAFTANLDKWEPLFIQGFGTGKMKVSLQLVDKDNNPVNGPMTSITRDFTLAAGEPLK